MITKFRLALLSIFLVSNYAVAQKYLLNPGDKIRVEVLNDEELTRELVVRPDRYITLPLIGAVETTDLDIEELSRKIELKYFDYMKDSPQVIVTLLEVVGNKIYIVGKVKNPGEYLINGKIDIMQALAIAGGLNEFADEDEIKILRRDNLLNQQTLDFNYNEVISGSELNLNIYLESNDIVIVP